MESQDIFQVAAGVVLGQCLSYYLNLHLLKSVNNMQKVRLKLISKAQKSIEEQHGLTADILSKEFNKHVQLVANFEKMMGPAMVAFDSLGKMHTAMKEDCAKIETMFYEVKRNYEFRLSQVVVLEERIKTLESQAAAKASDG